MSSDARGQRLLAKERAHETSEKVKRVFPMHLASSGDCEDSFSEALSFARQIADTDFTPLNGGPDRPLSRIIGPLDSLNAQKGEKDVPVFEETGGACPDIFVGAVPVAQA